MSTREIIEIVIEILEIIVKHTNKDNGGESDFIVAKAENKNKGKGCGYSGVN